MDSSHCLKKDDNFYVTALQKLQSEWPSEALTQEAWAGHAGPEPALSYPHEFATVQIKLRTGMHLSRTGTYLCSCHTIVCGSELLCAKKPLQSLLVHQLKAQRKVRLNAEG